MNNILAFCILILTAVESIKPIEATPLSAEYIFSSSPAEDIQKVFDIKIGNPFTWLGADCATAIQLNSDRTLYLWGDTLLGQAFANRTRKWEYFVHNSVSIMEDGALKTYWQLGDTSKPNNGGIFYPPDGKNAPWEYYWVTTGAPISGTDEMILLAARIRPGNGTLTIPGSAIIHVKNTTDIPTKWTYTTANMSGTTPTMNWYPCMFDQGDYLYMIGQEKTWTPVLSRISRSDAITDNWNATEYWGLSKTHYTLGWVTGNDLHKLQKLDGLVAQSELSIYYNPTFKRYYTFILLFSSGVIQLYTAEELTGPWEGPIDVYHIPKPYSDYPEYFTYSPKAHPELATSSDELIMSYNVNSPHWIKHAETDIEFYVPQFVRIKFSPKTNPTPTPRPRTPRPLTWGEGAAIIGGGIALTVSIAYFWHRKLKISRMKKEADTYQLMHNESV